MRLPLLERAVTHPPPLPWQDQHIEDIQMRFRIVDPIARSDNAALEYNVFERAGYVSRMRVGHVISSLGECSRIRSRNRGGRVNRNHGPAVPEGCPQGQQGLMNAQVRGQELK